MLRPGPFIMCSIALSCLALGPAACSGSDDNSIAGSAGKLGTTGGHGGVGGGGRAAGGAGGSSDGADGGSSAASGGTVGDAGMAGGSLGGGGALSEGGAAGEDGGAGQGGSGASGVCDAVVVQHELSPGIHVAACTAIDYATNPPSSGEHYPTWADYGVYDFALPRGYWMHNLEHGSVVVTYNCVDCGADLAAAKAWLAQLSPDAACPGGTPRVLLVPDPQLDVAWAASSWGFTLSADCFDAEAFSDFYVKHAGQAPAPEAGICSTGFDFRAPGANTCGVAQ
jgi:hypothetical protein